MGVTIWDKEIHNLLMSDNDENINLAISLIDEPKDLYLLCGVKIKTLVALGLPKKLYSYRWYIASGLERLGHVYKHTSSYEVDAVKLGIKYGKYLANLEQSK